MWDLPRRFQEFFCMNCGERFWVDLAPEIPKAVDLN